MMRRTLKGPRFIHTGEDRRTQLYKGESLYETGEAWWDDEENNTHPTVWREGITQQRWSPVASVVCDSVHILRMPPVDR